MIEHGPTVRHLTQALGTWQDRVFDPEQRDPRYMLARASQEINELKVAVCDRGGSDEILDESVDVVIGILGIALTVAEPKRVAEALFDKFVLMMEKYPAGEIEEMKRGGMNTYEALHTRKTLWQHRTLPTNGQVYRR